MQRQLFSSIQSQYDLDAHVQANFSYNKIQIIQKPQLYNSKLIQKVILQNQDIKTRGIKTHVPFNLQDISKSRSYTQIQEITILPNLEVRDPEHFPAEDEAVGIAGGYSLSSVQKEFAQKFRVNALFNFQTDFQYKMEEYKLISLILNIKWYHIFIIYVGSLFRNTVVIRPQYVLKNYALTAQDCMEPLFILRQMTSSSFLKGIKTFSSSYNP
ncbi:Hypothetical_protein [Hexamita inflata]|uniref:Hypothetical_protein n=1 Tax=Hexamita inflata TaxID=28002 RepID=A0AA86N4V5_9EUKA|nr:Hypothetical protein HINF_LOCUS410 [Hexamita inflata]